jgi:hypothetical protein
MRKAAVERVEMGIDALNAGQDFDPGMRIILQEGRDEARHDLNRQGYAA